MLGNSHFYNRTIRKIVVAFGTIFNDVQIIRYNKAGTVEYERFKVPLSYGPKEKYLTKIQSDPNLTKSIQTYLPRMSFELTGISYDSSRKLSSLTQNFNMVSGDFYKQYAPIPYNFEFSLSLYARNHEDASQILEQILPFFTPDFTITLNLIPNLGLKYDMPVILNNVDPQIEYEGDLLSTRTIIWTLNFTIKSYIFPPVKENANGIIKQANTNIYVTQVSGAQKVYVDYANGFGVFTTNETVRVQNKDIRGIVTYFSNNSVGTLVLENLTDMIKENDVVIGDYSNSKYTVDTVDVNPVKSIQIITRPDPTTAEADDDYGFTETINFYPNIT